MKNNNHLSAVNNNVTDMKKDERDTLIQQLLNQNMQDVQNELERVKTNQNAQNERIDKVESDLKDKITIDYGQQSSLQYVKKKRVEELWKIGGNFTEVLDTKRKLHARAWSDLYRSFGVSSYRDLKSIDFEEARDWMKVWRPQIF